MKKMTFFLAWVKNYDDLHSCQWVSYENSCSLDESDDIDEDHIRNS